MKIGDVVWVVAKRDGTLISHRIFADRGSAITYSMTLPGDDAFPVRLVPVEEEKPHAT